MRAPDETETTCAGDALPSLQRSASAELVILGLIGGRAALPMPTE